MCELCNSSRLRSAEDKNNKDDFFGTVHVSHRVLSTCVVYIFQGFMKNTLILNRREGIGAHLYGAKNFYPDDFHKHQAKSTVRKENCCMISSHDRYLGTVLSNL